MAKIGGFSAPSQWPFRLRDDSPCRCAKPPPAAPKSVDDPSYLPHGFSYKVIYGTLPPEIGDAL